MTANDHEKAEKLYHQILDQLEEIWHLHSTAGDDEEPEEEPGEDANDRDIVDAMVEDAAERGMDEESVERVFKAISALAKKAQEG